MTSPETNVTEMQERYLFLVEFFVKQISGPRLAKLNGMFFVPTSVSFRLPNFGDEVEITPVNTLFEPQAGVGCEVEDFHAGRSILFAIEHCDVIDKHLPFEMTFVVSKKMPQGVKPDVLVGVGQLDMSRQFAALRKEMLDCWRRDNPPAKIFEGQVPLVYEEGIVGCCSVFVRVSTFGQTIITEFEAPPSNELASAYVFKGRDAYNCRIVDPQTMDLRNERERTKNRESLETRYECSSCGQKKGAVLQSSVRVDDTSSAQANVKKTRDFGKAVVLKVSGLLMNDECKRPVVRVATEAEASEDPPDKDHDVFVLRIGKKGLVGMNEKSDIQLEMRTPKRSEIPPAVRLETREMQTEKRSKKKKNKPKIMTPTYGIKMINIK